MSLQAKTAYLTVNEANNYFAGKLETEDWDDADPVTQLKALTQASADIDKLAYIGTKLDPQQEHEFPRKYQNPLVDSTPYDGNIPLEIKYAVCEQALALLGGFSVTKQTEEQNISDIAYASVSTGFTGNPMMHESCGLTPEAWQFVLPFLRDSNALVMSRV